MWEIKYILKKLIIFLSLYLIISVCAPIQQILEPFITFNNLYH